MKSKKVIFIVVPIVLSLAAGIIALLCRRDKDPWKDGGIGWE
jgi:hypothetical protein